MTVLKKENKLVKNTKTELENGLTKFRNENFFIMLSKTS